MKKLLLLVLIAFSVVLGYSFGFDKERNPIKEITSPKKEILRVGLVADSHNENRLLERALFQAKSEKVDFVIGLGDYTNLGKIDELAAAKKVFDESGLSYYVIAGDRDGWESRERGDANTANFSQIFGSAQQTFSRSGVQFVLLDNSDLYKGISEEGWQILEETKSQRAKGDKDSVSSGSSVTLPLIFIFAHKTPFHPDSAHIMGAESPDVASQAKNFMDLMEGKKVEDPERSRRVDGFFSGDIHFFARFNSPSASVRITTIGAVASERNFQGPRFGILKVFEDYSWEVSDVEIK